MLECIDASSDYCPCYLAEFGECLTCSLLQGEAFCDCNWTGTCIFQEYVWLGFKNRRKILCKIIEKKIINDLLILTLEVPRKVVKCLEKPGSYIFLRNYHSSSFFDAPIAVMHVDEECVKVAVQVKGPKTKSLLRNCNDLVYLRGPYWNGVFGLKQLLQTYHSKCLVILSGVAQASGVLVINALHKNRNKITVIIDKSYPFFIKKYISRDVKVYEEDLSSEFLKDFISDENVKFIYIGGSDRLQRRILELAQLYNPAVHIGISNNNKLCCGEGICGSCELNGQKLKGCKVQFDPKEML